MKTLIRITAMLLAATTIAITARAQVMEKKSLTIDGAKRVIAAAVAEAKRLNAPGGVIAVVDDGGNLMALERLDGTFAAGASANFGPLQEADQGFRRHHQERPHGDGLVAGRVLHSAARRNPDSG
jgi:glc operon protein GlcG